MLFIHTAPEHSMLYHLPEMDSEESISNIIAEIYGANLILTYHETFHDS